MTSFLSHLIKNFRLSRQICHLQQTSRQILLFRLKSHPFRTYFLYMIRYNYVSRTVHNSPTIPCDPSFKTLPAQNWGVATPPTPRIDAYGSITLQEADSKEFHIVIVSKCSKCCIMLFTIS